MPRKTYTESQLLELVRTLVDEAGGQAEAARKAGISRQYVHLIIAGKHSPEKLVEALGGPTLERVYRVLPPARASAK